VSNVSVRCAVCAREPREHLSLRWLSYSESFIKLSTQNNFRHMQSVMYKQALMYRWCERRCFGCPNQVLYWPNQVLYWTQCSHVSGLRSLSRGVASPPPFSWAETRVRTSSCCTKRHGNHTRYNYTCLYSANHHMSGMTGTAHSNKELRIYKPIVHWRLLICCTMPGRGERFSSLQAQTSLLFNGQFPWE
jgi:hypothetical protein